MGRNHFTASGNGISASLKLFSDFCLLSTLTGLFAPTVSSHEHGAAV